jgi:glucokinase
MRAKDFFIGVDLGGTSMRAGVVTKRGKVIAAEKRKTQPRGAHPIRGNAKATVERLAETIERALKEADLKLRDIGGIGVAIPGVVDFDAGVVRLAPNLGSSWKNFAFVKTLQQHLGRKVFLFNDVRAGAIGEHTFGAGRGVQDMVAIFVGTGIGGGIILDGRLRSGFRGCAGEVGHTVIAADNDIIGITGQPGTVEPLTARSGMERMIENEMKKGRSSVVPELIQSLGQGRLTSSAIAEALQLDDALMKEVLGRAQHYLGILAANLVNILDPEVVVFGGGVTERLGMRFIRPIHQVAMKNFIQKHNARLVKFLPAALKDNSGVVGAAVLARRQG